MGEKLIEMVLHHSLKTIKNYRKFMKIYLVASKNAQTGKFVLQQSAEKI